MAYAVQQLVDDFENRLLNMPREGANVNGDTPLHPILVFYFDADGDPMISSLHRSLFQNLKEIWPQSRHHADSLRFFGINNAGEILRHYPNREEVDNPSTLGDGEYLDIILELYRVADRDLERSKVCCYFLFCSQSDQWNSRDLESNFQDFCEATERIKEKLRDILPGSPTLACMSVVVLDDMDPKKKDGVRGIKTSLSAKANETSTLLISNLCGSNYGLPMESLVRVISLTITLSDWKKRESSVFFQPGVQTLVSGAYRKPVRDIALSVIRRFMQLYRHANDNASKNIESKEQILKKIGSLKHGKFILPEEIISKSFREEYLADLTPQGLLGVFPRKSPAGIFETVTLEKFNDITMNSFQAYFYKELYLKLRDRLLYGEDWKPALQGYWKRKLSFYSLVEMARCWDDFYDYFPEYFVSCKEFWPENILSVLPQEYLSASVDHGVPAALCWLLSTDEDLRKHVFSCLHELCVEKMKFNEERNVFCESFDNVAPPNESIEKYYNDKTERYFESDGFTGILNEIIDAESFDQMQRCINHFMDNILQVHRADFGMSFDSELLSRLSDTDKEGTINTIYEQVWDKKERFLVLIGIEGSPSVFTCIVMDTDKLSLKNRLKDKINEPDLRFYDTDKSDAVEVFKLIKIDDGLL